MGQREAFVRLCGEMTARIAAVRGPSTPSTRPITVEFRSTQYQVQVFNRTHACTLPPQVCGDEMLALLLNGITEAGVTALLSTWSVQAMPGVLPPQAEGGGMAAS